jgi:hypothetical protein
MYDEESPLIELPCRICLDHIENPYQYCYCKDNLFYHKECMEKWINENNITQCEICKKELKLVRKINYLKLITPYFLNFISISMTIFICVLFIIGILTNKYNNTTYKIFYSILVVFMGIYIILSFMNFIQKCIPYQKYTLFLTK